MVFPGPALRQMQSQAAGRASEASGEGEEAPPEGLGGHQLLAQADARGPACQVVGHDLDGQPGGVGGEAARGEVVEPDAVLEVADGVLDLGVAAMVGLQFQGVAVPVRDKGVIAVVGQEGQLRAGCGLDPADDEAHRRGVGLGIEGCVAGLGHVGSAVHPVGDGRPVRLGYGLDLVAQALVLPDGDGEADIGLAADRDDGVGVEAAVGPHREWSGGPAVAHSSHRLPQEVGGAPSRIGAARALSGHQHVAGVRGDGQQRVIAPLAGVAVTARSLLAQSVGLADGGVQVDGQRPVAGSRPSGPGPRQQLPAHPIQLANMTPTEAAQKGPQGGWRLDHAADGPGRTAGAQHVGVVDAVATGQGRGHQGQQLVSRVRTTRRSSQINVVVDELTQTRVLGEGDRKEQPSIGHQAVVVEGYLDAVGLAGW